MQRLLAYGDYYVLESYAKALVEAKEQEYQSLLEHHEAQTKDWNEERDELKAELEKARAEIESYKQWEDFNR